ncbi:MAG: hypothetical protein FJX74_08935 [Armatimonadetes bacterium]|nr:hypothetical protein [Armatimonadota bacterium]
MRALIAAVAAVGLAAAAHTQSSDSHVVRVTVLQRNSIVVVGGDITLIVNPLSPPTVNQTCDVMWFCNGQGNRKITVRSSLVNPRYSLTVEARNITGNGQNPGIAAGVVPLRDGVDRDFITRIRSSLGAADLRYSASATWAAGLGTDVHTVTYTLADR